MHKARIKKGEHKGKTTKKKYTDVLFKNAYERIENAEGYIVDDVYKRAWDTRNFEIGLYWKRAIYFWGFIAACAVGLFHAYELQTSIPFRSEAILLFSCLGTLFSWAWYLVNKGSKFWQENWEHHISFLEDICGHNALYKTVFFEDKKRKFSVSKINEYLSLSVFIFWLVSTIKIIVVALGVATVLFSKFHSLFFEGFVCLATTIIIFVLYFVASDKYRERTGSDSKRKKLFIEQKSNENGSQKVYSITDEQI